MLPSSIVADQARPTGYSVAPRIPASDHDKATAEHALRRISLSSAMLNGMFSYRYIEYRSIHGS